MSDRGTIEGQSGSDREGGLMTADRHKGTTRTTRRRLAGLGGGAILAPALAGCAAGGGAGEAGAGAGKVAPATVQLWHADDHPLYGKVVETWLPAFNGQHPQVKVEYAPRPPQWQEKLTAALVAGTPPDVVAASARATLLPARRPAAAAGRLPEGGEVRRDGLLHPHVHRGELAGAAVRRPAVRELHHDGSTTGTTSGRPACRSRRSPGRRSRWWTPPAGRPGHPARAGRCGG